MGKNTYTANQDIRDYMADHGVTQRMLAAEVGVSQTRICKELSTELSEKEKERYLNMIDAIASDASRDLAEAEEVLENEPEEEAEAESVSPNAKFQIGDRVKYPSAKLKIGIVADIWQSFASQVRMYTVRDEEDGHCAMFSETQLEPAPIPIEYTFSAACENNVAVVCMMASQGEKTWVYARGHAHILHDGEVGMAQAVSYAAKRMFESLDKKQGKQIYFK